MKKVRVVFGWLLMVILIFVSMSCRTRSLCSARGRESKIGERARLYYLPFKAGTRHTCIQGESGLLSHSGPNHYAIDFRMPVGTPVLAARAGRVVRIKEDSDTGGHTREYISYANYIRILHKDGTAANYFHLKKNGVVVKQDEQVRRGQIIGYSGDTGWSTEPHLHFQVDTKCTTGQWESVPIAFLDIAGDGVPRLFQTYKSGNVLAPLD